MALVFSGIHLDILEDETPELDVEGARMSAKTWTISEKVRRSCLKYPGIWWLISRYSGTETDNQLRPQFMKVCRVQGTEPEWHDDESAYWFPEVDGKVSKVFAFGLKTQSRDQRYAKIRGSGFAGVWLDQAEEVPEDIGTEIRALLRQPDYPHQLIYSPNPPGEEHFLADLFPDDQNLPGRKYYRLSLYDNKHNLPAETIEKMERAYPITHAKNKSLILGMRGPNVVGTPVYDGVFHRDQHLQALRVDPGSHLLEAIDVGKQNPVWIVGQRSSHGGLNILGGVMGKRMFLEDFLPIVDYYRSEWFEEPDRSKFQLCCDPPPSDEDGMALRYTHLNILREAGLSPRFRANSNSPDVRESVIQHAAGLMRRQLGTRKGITVNADMAKWVMASALVKKQTGLFIDGLESSYVWDEHLISVGSKKVRQPKADQWVDGWQRCLENMLLNFSAGQESTAERDARAAKMRSQTAAPFPSGSWMSH